MDTTTDPAFLPPRTEPLERVSFLGGPFSARTWREYGYLLLAAPWSAIGFTYVLAMIGLTAGLLVTVVGGAGILGAMILGARGLGAADRGLARGALRAQIATPMPFRRRPGFWGGIWSMVSDGVGWRAVAFLVLQLPLAFVSFAMSTVWLVAPLGAMTHWIWGRYLPGVVGSDGQVHHGSQPMPDYFIDTPLRHLGFAAAGLVLLLIGVSITRGLAHLHRMLAEGLLGPTAASLRVASLEQSRGRAVEDADSTLRRIERDLHDGTQARLVAIAMQLGEAKEQAAAQRVSRELAELIDAAHTSTKETLVELRELARGIHPPALDNGLAVALETLAARSPLPVQITAGLGHRRPAEAIETIAYFCVTELLTNAIKHAQASRLEVRVEERGGNLRLEVRDDGIGGAVILVPDVDGNHSGLAGLAERVGSVDGEFTVSSPAGGPTVVIIVLPLHV